MMMLMMINNNNNDNNDDDRFVCLIVCCLSGSVMNGFQASTNTKIKISQNNDFFPETMDRVIAITGRPENVTAALSSVMEKMCEVPTSIFLFSFINVFILVLHCLHFHFTSYNTTQQYIHNLRLAPLTTIHSRAPSVPLMSRLYISTITPP